MKIFFTSKHIFFRTLRQISFYLIFFLGWQFLFNLKLWPPYLFPSSWQVFETILDGFGDSRFLFGIMISLKRMLLGYALSVFFGVFLGFLIGKLKILDETLGSLFVGLQTLPSICWLPLAILWFGKNEPAITFVIVTGSLLSIAIATDQGVKSIPSIYLSVARNIGANGFRMFVDVVLPASLPSILIGLKQGWIFAWRSLMAAEMLFASLGLGHLLDSGRDMNDTKEVMAILVVMIAIGIFINTVVFGFLERKVRKAWGMEPA